MARRIGSNRTPAAEGTPEVRVAIRGLSDGSEGRAGRPTPRRPEARVTEKHRDLPALTGLRFFLALWVILHHLTGPGQDLEAVALQLPHGLFTLIRGGYQAVTT